MTVPIALRASALVALPVLALPALAAGGSSGAAPVDAPAPPPTITVVSRFDAAGGEPPEGLTVVDGVPRVGLAPTSQVARVDPATGAWSPSGALPTVAPGTGFMTGITSGAADPGAIYAALASFTPDVRAGIYRIAPAGGAATLVASHPDLAFPNGVSECRARGDAIAAILARAGHRRLTRSAWRPAARAARPGPS